MITITILTKNSQATLPATLDSVKSFPNVLLFDTGSTDQTLHIAALYPNVKVIQGIFTGFGSTHNSASSLAQTDWILSLDSDEVLSPALIDELNALELDQTRVYSIQRHNYFNGKWIKWCGGWHPDWVVRLYNRKTTRFTDSAVHEKIIAEDLIKTPLKAPMTHVPYQTINDFLAKMQTYSTLFAEDNTHKKTASLFKAIYHGWFAFFKSYILKRGFLGRKEGFIISVYNGHTTFYKYLKLLTKGNFMPIAPISGSFDSINSKSPTQQLYTLWTTWYQDASKDLPAAKPAAEHLLRFLKTHEHYFTQMTKNTPSPLPPQSTDTFPELYKHTINRLECWIDNGCNPGLVTAPSESLSNVYDWAKKAS